MFEKFSLSDIQTYWCIVYVSRSRLIGTVLAYVGTSAVPVHRIVWP